GDEPELAPPGERDVAADVEDSDETEHRHLRTTGAPTSLVFGRGASAARGEPGRDDGQGGDGPHSRQVDRAEPPRGLRVAADEVGSHTDPDHRQPGEERPRTPAAWATFSPDG